PPGRLRRSPDLHQSKGELGSRRDRHEHIGRGRMGLEPAAIADRDRKAAARRRRGAHGMSPPAEERLRITEIYRSIQGESTYAGLPCVFVRLTGCALRCVWCDSEYTFTGGEWMSVGQVLARVRALGAGLVEFTGGEPLLQKSVHEAIGALCDEGAT